MRTIISLTLLAVILTACNSKTELAPEEIIAGSTSKVWKATSETTASGDAAPMSEEEQNETMRFNTNGTFSMQSAAEMATGTWSYDPAGPTLKLIFDDEDYSESFKIRELSEGNMSLEAADGSQMNLTEE